MRIHLHPNEGSSAPTCLSSLGLVLIHERLHYCHSRLCLWCYTRRAMRRAGFLHQPLWHTFSLCSSYGFQTPTLEYSLYSTRNPHDRDQHLLAKTNALATIQLFAHCVRTQINKWLPFNQRLNCGQPTAVRGARAGDHIASQPLRQDFLGNFPHIGKESTACTKTQYPHRLSMTESLLHLIQTRFPASEPTPA